MVSHHDKFQDDQFDSSRDFAHGEGAQKTLIIASSERSGSHLLGQVLGATGCFGDPLEYMHPSHIKRWMQALDADTAQKAMRAVQNRRTSPNGVFAVKMHYSHLTALGGMRVVKEVFPDPRVVVLRRRNTLKQAVSYAVAAKSGLWIADTADAESLPYNRGLIEWALAHSIREHANWRFDVLKSGLPILDIDHEEVVSDVPAAVKRVAGFLDVDVPADRIPPHPVTRKQSSAINDAWLARFIDETSSRPSAGLPIERSPLVKHLAKLRATFKRSR